MRGYDEDFKTYGCEDNDFADRLIKMGVSYIYLDSRMLEKNAYTGPNMLDERYEPYCCLGFHQGHRRWEDSPRYESSYETLKRKVDQWQKGKIGYKRNLGREWGVLHNGFTIYNNEGTTVKRTIRNDLEVV
ncbi:MAG: hypothetical protein HQ538_02555 [Parcubacteria group bacterium]|nr:hypothetical protein [Parcubacteria group bacterium]